MKNYKSVLIIDDDVDLCLALKAILTVMFPEVLDVHTLKSARESLEHEMPGVIFLDNNLPDGQGLELIKEIKLLSPNSIIIVISAADNLKDSMLSDGADIFLDKPLTYSSISKALSNTNVKYG